MKFTFMKSVKPVKWTDFMNVYSLFRREPKLYEEYINSFT